MQASNDRFAKLAGQSALGSGVWSFHSSATGRGETESISPSKPADKKSAKTPPTSAHERDWIFLWGLTGGFVQVCKSSLAMEEEELATPKVQVLVGLNRF